MTPDRNQSNLKAPLQQRSRETLDRIFVATQELLADKRFDEISIAQIAKRAGCGVGTVYGRFENKDALLAELEERIVVNIIQRQQAFLSSESWDGIKFDARVDRWLEHIIGNYKRHRAILRELVSRVHQVPGGAKALSRARMTKIFDNDVQFFVDALAVSRQTKAKKIVGLGMMSVIATLQNRMLQSETSPIDRTFPESFLKSELAKMMVGYVDIHFKFK